MILRIFHQVIASKAGARTMRYRHTQIGWMILIALAVSLIVLGALRMFIPNPEAGIAFAIAFVVLIGAMILFGSLTVEVDDEFIRLRFGPGLIRKTIRLSDVAACKAARNRWWYGWGIRLIPGGWLFNVSGLGAVELRMKKGKTYRIGTDEPQKLCSAIQSKLEQSKTE